MVSSSRSFFVKNYCSSRANSISGRTLAIAGDLGDSAETTVLILRNAGKKQSAAKFDVKAIKSGKMADPTLRAGDRVVVGESAIKKSYNFLLKTLPVLARFAIFL